MDRGNGGGEESGACGLGRIFKELRFAHSNIFAFIHTNSPRPINHFSAAPQIRSKTMPASSKRPSLSPLFPLGPSPLKMLLFIVLPLLLSLICLPNSVDSKPQHRHRRHHHHHHNRRSSDHFMFKDVLKNCSVPPQCRDSVMRALEFQERVPECDPMDYFDLLFCLDREIMSRTNVTYLNSMAGRNCCDEYVEDVSSFCRQACRSALFAPTMGHEQKQKQLEMVCDRRHGDEKRGDSGLLNCLATQQDWLEKKHKVMMRR